MQADDMNRSGRVPWYRHPWVWVLIAIPMTAVVAGIFTIYLAVSSSDGLVVDDYYKRGKVINRVLARDRAAAERGLVARLALDAANGRVTLELDAREGPLPPAVSLALLHPTIEGHDQHVQLAAVGGNRYMAPLAELRAGNWHVQLETDDWRLTGRIRTPLQAPVVLAPAGAAPR